MSTAPSERLTAALSQAEITKVLDQAEAAAKKLRAMGAGAAIITLGDKGALYHDGTRTVHVPPFKAGRVVALDTTANLLRRFSVHSLRLRTDGVMPAATIFASRKRSIELAALPSGMAGEVSGWRLHQLRRTCRRSDQAGVIESSGALVRGSGAPRFTHSAKSAMIFASSLGRFLGICSVSWL